MPYYHSSPRRPAAARDTRIANTEEFLAFVAQSINDDGWVSGSVAYNTGVQSTAARAWEHYHDMIVSGYRLDQTPSVHAYAVAQLSLEWARSLPKNGAPDDYMTKIAIFALADETSDGMKGYIASIIGAYERAESERVTRAENAASPSRFLGTEGAKLTTVVKVTDSREMDGYRLNIFQDANGNVLTWSTQRGFSVGQTITLTGTIKAHREFRGMNQTQLTRCKVSY